VLLPFHVRSRFVYNTNSVGDFQTQALLLLHYFIAYVEYLVHFPRYIIQLFPPEH